MRDENAFQFEEDLSDSFDLRRKLDFRLRVRLRNRELRSEANELRADELKKKRTQTHRGSLVFSLPDLFSICPQGP